MKRKICSLAMMVLCLLIATMATALAYPTGKVVNIPSGIYRVSSAAADFLVLDVDCGRNENGTNIQLWSWYDKDQQKIKIVRQSNGYYTMQPLSGDKYIDAAGGLPNDGTNVQLYTYNGSDAQLWRFISAGDNTVYIESKMRPGLSFDCQNGRVHDGTNVHLWTRGNVLWDKWKLKLITMQTSSKTSSSDSSPTKYVVSTNSANLLLRSGPGSNYAIKARMPRGSVVDVYSISNGWAKVSYNGTIGYASSGYLTRQYSASSSNTSSSNSTEKYVVSTSSANLLLRSGPGSNYAIKARMPRGSVVDVYSVSNGWAKVSYNGTIGYASSGYLTRQSSASSGSTSSSVDNNSSATIIKEPMEQNVITRMGKLQGINGYALNHRYTGSGQCRGFANKVYQALFNVSYISGYTNDNYGAASYSGSYVVGSLKNIAFAPSSLTAIKELFLKAKPGAFVQMGRRHSLNSSKTAPAPHSAIIESFSGTGVRFYEANTDGKNTIKSTYYSWADLLNKNKGFTIYLPNNYSLR